MKIIIFKHFSHKLNSESFNYEKSFAEPELLAKFS